MSVWICEPWVKGLTPIPYKLVTIANEVAIMVNAAKAIVKDIKSA
mgnify:CR=1 FL=1